MNTAIIAAMQMCLSIASVALPNGPTGPMHYVYPAGYERCDAILLEYDAERKAGAAEAQAARDAEARKIYQAGLAALPAAQ